MRPVRYVCSTDYLSRTHNYLWFVGENKRRLGELGAVPHVVAYLTSEDPGVHQATCKALHMLSADGTPVVAHARNI